MPPHGILPEFPTGHTGTIKLVALFYLGFDLLDVMGLICIHGKNLSILNIEFDFQNAFHYTLESAPKLDIFFMPEGPKNVKWVKHTYQVQYGTFLTASGVRAGIRAALYVVSQLTSVKNH
ncbi:hypothetical protein BGZ93_005580 [Podila epicladia]|nr:hypothetical protein BGZ92_001257 [Podila epicladia]KAG0095666.1 hypothetical protein BGZ93_005580 [Podila epicladia]